MNKLHISQENRLIAGVCGGIGETYNLDITLVRLIFVVLTLLYGIGLVLYIVMLLVIPKNGAEYEIIVKKENNDEKFKKLYRLRDGQMVAGVCAGVSAMFNIDVSIIRIVWVCLSIFSSGVPVLLYIVMWAVVPYRD